ncbi:hypothetical protein [Microbacterium sp. 18062]|uniref:hypothetical protein n=1 Tax=Microbacterium sp. 18062 TaxID=2681410 RepID=UPI001F36B70F|nr:hypothetical protein [Microbacterium sp. 18062]
MSGSTEPSGSVSPSVSLALATIGFFTLVIAGLGLASLATDTEVVEVPGLGPVPGAVGLVGAGGAFAWVVWTTVRAPHPRFVGAFWGALAAYLAYGTVAGAAALAVTGGPARAVAVTGSLLVGWPGAVIAASAAVAAWAAIALVRTRARRPRWPWERDEDE